MPILTNSYNNNSFTPIYLELNFLKNNKLSYCSNRDDYLNWIPFELILKIGENEVYNYSQEYGATFNLEELDNYFTGVYNLLEKIETRDYRDEKIFKETRSFEFYTLESYFSIIFADAFDDLISVTLWVNMGSLSNGRSSGYERGFRFPVALNDVVNFTTELKEQLATIIN